MTTSIPDIDKLRDALILGMGVGNWKRLPINTRVKLQLKLESYISQEILKELETIENFPRVAVEIMSYIQQRKSTLQKESNNG